MNPLVGRAVKHHPTGDQGVVCAVDKLVHHERAGSCARSQSHFAVLVLLPGGKLATWRADETEVE